MSLHQRIERTDGICGGKPRVAGHRITVQDIAVWHERMGWSVGEIASEYDLSLAAAHAASAYYLAYGERIDRSIEEGGALVEKMKEQMSSTGAEPLDKQRE
ncbi:DUF433 domain-containing protein [Salinibacter ruber]|uniref:DUF433 domain-containing protein n=1 Tax=Salinibacter ruber TaxID=146919 RepID=UPI0021671AD2|nr:DUF433 domain-containing protein [Salinibacter ruber]MCS4119628.1 uncharacterized protein (DUF433 family) [Salinibacter ruber]